MNIILFSKREGLARQLNLAHPVTLGVLAVLVLGILGTAFALGMQLGQQAAAGICPRRIRALERRYSPSRNTRSRSCKSA